MNQSVNTFIETNEDSKICNITYRSFDNTSNRITIKSKFPRICLDFLNREGNPFAFHIKVFDDCFHRLAEFNNLRRMPYSLGPWHFGNVNESFDSWFNFDKGAVVCQADNFSGNFCSNCKFVFHHFPRILSFLLETKRNLLIIRKILEYNNFYFITNFKHFRRMHYASPSHICNME